MKKKRREKFNPKNSLIGNFRISKKLTRDRLAVLIGVTSQTIGRWERGDNKPSKLAQEKIAKTTEMINREKNI